ncbi:hypothetical protein AAZX31_17G172900 [Glycine max]|uniref:Nucleotide-diphospho-sugar transferase domain-containing protein n=2 Tax=Glycine subgen. Soja TaxID=1462606 RepID=K7MMB5_SOYBN|nr:uncharacterized protein At4g15970 isoform X1 [Glycine max]XP_028208995.1 uncharacterized protein At4g15970-like isoform X1 [Glycine soja]KAG4930869.1 hypothetical protein JHK86_047830 [Glycine max]KAH1118992.1 hypothetical protein GYH30_047679 [Glycine max]KAH1202893.1 Uncharacterized protein GmHk_17G049244 [Glycine max]KRH04716.1 hypothetical protein GLYMA_17G181100v4 [Glycine max]RZB57447.1 hypothetical protein D0Y65_046205 [Glycine soja]|eukprot:XP_006601015.1 uncharacterized protein At4g15970 [Glycine max]
MLGLKAIKPSFSFGRMRALRLRNYVYLPLLAFLIVLVCFLLYHYPRSLERGVTKGVLLRHKSTYYSKNQELDDVLRRAIMPDRSVILTMVNKSMASPGSILDILLQSFKSGDGTQRLLNHMVIITMDPHAFEYCRSLHPYCIHPSIFPHHFVTKRGSIITTPDQNLFTWTRNDVLFEVIQLGYSIIFTEADVLWLRSPLIKLNPSNELTISCNVLSDGQSGSYLHGGGIFFLKANAISLEFFKYWKLTKFMFPNDPAEESLCNTIKARQDAADLYGFRAQLVNTSYFGGFCQPSKNMLREAYTIQANCCDDLESKVHDLRIVLGDWIRFRNHASGVNALDKMDLRWPLKCSTRNYT